MGVEWRGTRFAEYLAIIEQVAEFERSADNRARYAAFRSDERNLGLFYEGASQFLQLQKASEVWSLLDRDLLRRKVRQVLRGDAMPAPRGRDDRPRDFLVELLAAALLKGDGFTPSLTENDADVQLSGFGFTQVIVECKRPSSIPNALNKVHRQLRRRTAAGMIGIPVLAIECALNLPYQRHTATSEASLDDALLSTFDTADDIVRKFDREQKGTARLRDVAPILIFVISGAVFLDTPEGSSVYCFTTRRPMTTPDARVPAGLTRAFRPVEAPAE